MPSTAGDVDWALAAPIPWRNPACALAATVQVGGTLAETAAAERDAWQGRHPERPFVLLAQPTLFDPSRAPAGRHIARTYCHVPRGSEADMLPRIERQIERFAPGYRDRVLARSIMGPADLERHNANGYFAARRALRPWVQSAHPAGNLGHRSAAR
ncbi:MAG: hypothetical protein HYY76_12715 [Acidobacteria bacterium]|nr:hypothetical protein [Acidobacteriota bacterium]